MDGFTKGYDVTTMNASADDIIEPKPRQIQFIASLTLEAIIATCSVWFIVKLIVHGVSTKRFRRRNKADTNGGVLYSLVVLAAVMSFARSSSSLLIIALSPQKPGYDVQCDRLMGSSFVIYMAALVSVYFSLWYRQRALYANRLLAQSHNKFVLAWSIFSGFLITVGSVSYTIYAVVTGVDGYESSYSGCIYTGRIARYLIGSILNTIMQFSLLVLFIIPLRRNWKGCANFLSFRKSMMQCINKQEPDTSGSGSSSQTCTDVVEETNLPEATEQIETKSLINKKILRLLKRLTFVTVVCIITDFLATVLAIVIIQNNGSFHNLTKVVYDVNLLFNVISVILSFDDYGKILCPCGNIKCV
uniref:Ci-YFV-3 receptor n=1 Tax=Ciona intestinalis TaxID=7719 RepID=A0A3Q9XUS7_CIOIN|nr:Ci-YFV-3 receptor [Ciona intestinalis]